MVVGQVILQLLGLAGIVTGLGIMVLYIETERTWKSI